MGRDAFSAGHPRVGQWVWIDECSPRQRLGVVQRAPASEGLVVHREGVRRDGGARVTIVESTAVLGGRSACALRDAPDEVPVCVVTADGGQHEDLVERISVRRLTPLLERTAIPWRRLRLMRADWRPRP